MVSDPPSRPSDMFSLIEMILNKSQKARLTIGLLAEVVHFGFPSIYKTFFLKFKLNSNFLCILFRVTHDQDGGNVHIRQNTSKSSSEPVPESQLR